ncbi:MAG: hypothetical protein WC714_29070 [Candidatus Obscuribacterales bacterium]|jgi:hypothetical protein
MSEKISEEQIAKNILKNTNALFDALFPPGMFNPTAVVNDREISAATCDTGDEDLPTGPIGMFHGRATGRGV